MRYSCPSTLPCGHTFCRDCIDRYWRDNAKCICPICQATFPSRPQLSKNTVLASLLDALQAQDTRAYEHCPSCAGPGAIKLCLPCMAPLCQEHIRLHCEDSAQQRHLLVNPLTAASAGPCRQHEKGLLYFCVPHSYPLCPACVGQHEECQPVPLLEVYEKNKEKYQKTINEIKYDITKKEEDISDKKNAYREVQILVCEIKENLNKEFRAMRDYLEKQERAAFWRIKQEQDGAQKKMNKILHPVIAEIDKIKKIKSQLEDNMQNDWFAVLKDTRAEDDIYRPSTTLVDEVLFDENRILDITLKISEIKKSLLDHAMLEEVHCPPKQVLEETFELQEAAASSSSQYPTAKPMENKMLQQWARDVVFDLQTISCRLAHSNDLKTVTVSTKTQYPNNPRRFTSCQVLGSEGFSTGCHYWEISTKNSSAWGVGVASIEIKRDAQLGRNGYSWCVEWNKGRLVAWHNEVEIPVRLPKPDVVGVLLDCHEKVVSFYSVSHEGQMLMHTFKLKINPQVFPAVWLYGLKTGNSLNINEIKKN
ncbi:E3 ubiquitin-protein ligase RNF135 [Discoglossus pictus]